MKLWLQTYEKNQKVYIYISTETTTVMREMCWCTIPSTINSKIILEASGHPSSSTSLTAQNNQLSVIYQFYFLRLETNRQNKLVCSFPLKLSWGMQNQKWQYDCEGPCHLLWCSQTASCVKIPKAMRIFCRSSKIFDVKVRISRCCDRLTCFCPKLFRSLCFTTH